jgi:hypothetical protein
MTDDAVQPKVNGMAAQEMPEQASQQAHQSQTSPGRSSQVSGDARRRPLFRS